MVTIQVEHLFSHDTCEYEISRVPCIGENLAENDELFTVVDVFHQLNVNPDNEPVAIVRVK